MGGKKKKALATRAQATVATKIGKKSSKGDKGSAKSKERRVKEERRSLKERRRKEKKQITAEQWAEPAPSHLVATLDIPRVKSKYQSYFEFAENTEKKEKRLEFQVTNDPNPPPGFAFVPIGDPLLTKTCKNLSRDNDAMIFIVSQSKEEASKISEHIYRSGYHFREMIVEEAREIVGETAVLARPAVAPGEIESIPESQEEINRQADDAIRDLFPRIPNTDRTMIIDHAFKKGGQFHGEPTVGLQPDLPLSRRVQLAVLAHIRHTHTRYDKLLRETSWMNARKAVEPVCLDVLVKWRGDEETGRDQMDEILREVVIITDSENEDDSSSEDDSSDEEGEITSASSAEVSPSQSPNQQRLPHPPAHRSQTSIGLARSGNDTSGGVSSQIRAETKPTPREKQHRGFKRYQAAWEDARNRLQDPSERPTPRNLSTPDLINTSSRPVVISSPHNVLQQPIPSQNLHYGGSNYHNVNQRFYDKPVIHSESHYLQHRPAAGGLAHRNEVIVRQYPEQHFNQGPQPRMGTPSRVLREQRPPLVVRGSPQRYGLQDMLVPSIESPTSDVFHPAARPIERRDAYDRFGHPQGSHPQRVIESRRLSPSRRQVIIIDDSPQFKRRRLVVEDDSGRFRSFPSRDYNDFAPASAADSHLLSSSSAQHRDFIVRHPAVQSESTEGLFRNASSLYDLGAPIPIYDIPTPGYLARPPDHFRRAETLNASQYEGTTNARPFASPKTSHTNEDENPQRPPTYGYEREVQSNRINDNGGFRQTEPENHGVHFIQQQSPNVSIPSRIFHSHDVSAGYKTIDQAFIQPFSQSQLDGPVRTRDGFSVLPHQSLSDQSNLPRGYHDHSAASFFSIPIARARSPAGYTENPINDHDQVRRPPIYENHQGPHQGNYSSGNQPPILVRQRVSHAPLEPPLQYRSHQEPPRRPVIVLE